MNPALFRTFRLACVITLAVVIPLSVAGCFDAEKEKARLDQTQSELAEKRLELEIERDRLASQKADTTDVEKSLARVAKLEGDLAAIRAVIDKSINPDGSLNGAAIGAAAGAVLPPPWNLVALLGAPLVTGLVQEFRLRGVKADADQIVDSVEAMRAASPTLKDAMKAAKDVASKQLTRPGARKLIAARAIT